MLNSLTNIVTPSTKHMSEDERAAGIQQMVADLERLARQDGCIAAAWALEALETLVSMSMTEAATVGEVEAG